MGNISKIAALTALITLAFGMSAIGVAMAEPEVIAKIEILSDKTARVVPVKKGLKKKDFEAFSKEAHKTQALSSTVILWSNPGWIIIKLDGRPYCYWCYQ